MNTTDQGELLSIKELAGRLKRHASYVYAMRARGFRMPGGRATVEDAMVWLESNPAPKARPGLNWVNPGKRDH